MSFAAFYITAITDNLPAGPVLTHKIDPSKGSTQTTSYNYGTSTSRLTSLLGAETASYGYNSRGDMTSLTEQGITYTPTYDLLHNLKTYKQGAMTIASYEYDGDGQRVTKTAGGTTTVYHHDKSGKLLSETDANGNRIADYVYVNGNMAAKVEAAGVSYYHTDPAGTPVAITDSTGALAWRAEYLPFGEEQLLVNNKVNDKMFVGKEKDEETGHYYFGARYLKDKIGMFMSVDPVGPVDSGSGKVNMRMLLNPQRLNRYAYAFNNPYTYIDPFGRSGMLIVESSGNGGSSMTSGHSWISYTKDGGGTTTYGTWGNNPNNTGNGLHENLEVGRAADASRGMHIDDAHETKMLGVVNAYKEKGADAWQYGAPCSTFARDAWEAGAGEHLNSNYGPISNPTTLKESIINANGGISHAITNKAGGSSSTFSPSSSSHSSGSSLNSSGRLLE